MIQQINDFYKNLSSSFSEHSIHYFCLTILAISMIIIAISMYRKTSSDNINCYKIENANSNKSPGVRSIDKAGTYKFRDYYVKTAYNACASGQFKNDFMNTCALENVIKQGARCIDFQIYSLDDEPVVAASSVKDFKIKETYNSVKLRHALKIIKEKAFVRDDCPNHEDPLILHFRIMSNNKKMYDKMALMLSEILSDRLLNPSYSYKRSEGSIGSIILSDLNKKVVIIVDESNKFFETTKLDELVNMTSGSTAMSSRRYDDVKYNDDPDDTIQHNKINITIVLPDLSISNKNHNAQVAWDYGCQFVAMCFQNLDNNMKNYNSMFSEKSSAFVLKPDYLRDTTASDTTTQDTSSYIYTPKTVTKDFYNFEL